MSKGFTIFLGIAEVAGGLGVAFGVLTQLAAFGLIVLMLGAIQKQNLLLLSAGDREKSRQTAENKEKKW
jgi:uncharacterized membrane protein